MKEEVMFNTVLTMQKNICEINLHGAIESSTLNIFEIFKKSLTENLNIQNQIYDEMTNQGWYKITNVPKEKITKAKQQFK